MSVTLTEAKREPEAVGAKSTAMMQEEFAASEPLEGQVVCGEERIRKSPAFKPIVVMLKMLRLEVPVLVRVIVFAEEVLPTLVLGNVSEVGLKLTPGAVPVPLRGMICGVPGASSATSTSPVIAPRAAGVNVTVIVQVPFAASEPMVAQVLLPEVVVNAKSDGVPTDGLMVTDEIVRDWLPVFVRVTVTGVDVVPVFTLPKGIAVGEN